MHSTLNISPMIIYVIDESIANILSFKEVENYFYVTMDTNEYHAMLVHFNKDQSKRF